VGFLIFGASTGLAVGLVESALKDRWLYVSGGPLAGKQFILYKPVTQFGSQQSNEIYLFKDPSIAPIHARIELRGSQAMITAAGQTYVGGQPVSQRVLRSGDVIQIGRYTFQYHEKNSRA
jgi:pSer/pThr/pTyr-binding forkhead associated (FHA) protein